MLKTIYITRLSAFQIQCGGIDRLQVWFSKPHYSEPHYFDELENPFASEREIGCYAKRGWQVHGGKTQTPVSFGGLFGYDTDLAEYVWNKLCEHFGNLPFKEWEQYEKDNPETCNIKAFYLKLEINISLSF